MGVKIYTIGGYSEVGRNMTAVEVDDEIVIFDMGVWVEKYIPFSDEGENIKNIPISKLIASEALPDDKLIRAKKEKVKAIVPTHAHLDHVGGILFLSNFYSAPIIATPYTTEIIKELSKNEAITLKNKIKQLNTNSSIKITETLTLEFINVTHSTLQVVMAALHTPYGIILYSNDFKFDNYPVIGQKPNYESLEKLGKKGVLALIVDSTYASSPIKTPSESVAKEMLRDVILGVNAKDNLIIVTTFASHIARLKSIVDFAKQQNRKCLFLGKSLEKYVKPAIKLNLIEFKEVEIQGFFPKIKKLLKKVEENRSKYLLVVTGNQGEPKSVLSKLIENKFNFQLIPNDLVIFSSRVIPVELNIENRKNIEEKLENKGIRMFKEIHVSGHAAREDLRDLFLMVKPINIIPAHGSKEMLESLTQFCENIGYSKGKTVHLVKNGTTLDL